jgi:ABC-type sugar transport system ATPase subunit
VDASDGEAVVGVRPEHLYLAAEGGRPVSATIDAAVDLVEYLGNEAHVTFSRGDNTLVSRVDARVKLKPGETVPLTVLVENVHLFDRASGRRLY